MMTLSMQKPNQEMSKVPTIAESLNLHDVQFPHIAPEGYHYKVKPFQRNILSIWLHHPDIYTYTSDRVSTIWGFYNTKTRQYYAPINSKKIGKIVGIDKTSAYTAMQLICTPLELAFNV